MDQLYSQLIMLLSRETDLYRALQDVLAEESRHLVANDAAGLLDATRRKDTISLQIRSLEESRYLLMDKLARALGRKPDELTVSQLCETAQGSSRAQLMETSGRLKSIVERVNAANDRNRQLVENSMRLLQGTMQAIQNHLRGPGLAPKGYPKGCGPARPRAVLPAGGMMVNQRV